MQEQNGNGPVGDGGYMDRVLMVLVRESRRAEEAAERVRLVVEAAAKRAGVSVPPLDDPK